MKFIAESIDSCSSKLRSLRFRQFDQFGNIPGFQLRGSDKFQTNAGAILTFVFVIQMALCISFYSSMLFDKSKPNIQTNIYEAQRETAIDFENDDIAWSFSTWASNLQRQLTIQELEENFTMYAAKMSFDTSGVETIPIWTPVPYIYCKDVKKDYILDTETWSHHSESICLDLSSISLNPNPNYLLEQVAIKLFRCQETLEDMQAGISKCKNDVQIENIFWLVFRIKKSFDLGKYKNPVSLTISELDSFPLDDNLKVGVQMTYQKTIIETEKGLLSQNIELISKVEEKEIKYQYTTRSPKQILNNYSALGKLYMEDSLWDMYFVPTNTVKVMQRTYFGIMDMFSDMGGVFEFMSLAIFLQYSFYNIYEVNRHIIQKVLLNNANILPGEYNIKKEFNHITRGKVCSCCFKKQLSDSLFVNKIKVYDDCYQSFNEKMDLANYLNDSMNFHATSHLLLKSRHRLLVPLLSLHMIGKKNKSDSVYRNTFLKNMYSRLDLPVFSVEDAVSQINKSASNNTAENLGSIEHAMDVFFMTNLPRDIIDQKECNLEKGNIKPVILVSNKVKALSQQNIANIIKEKKIGNSKPKFSSKNKIMPSVSTIRKQSDKKKCPSATELHVTSNNPSTNIPLQQLHKKSGINRLKRRRSSFIDQLINQQDMTISNSKNLMKTQTHGKDVFQKTFSLKKQAKLKRSGTTKGVLNKEKGHNEFGYQKKETTPCTKQQTIYGVSSDRSIKLEKEKDKLLINIDSHKKTIVSDCSYALQYDPSENQQPEELIKKGVCNSQAFSIEKHYEKKTKENEHKPQVLKLSEDEFINCTIDSNPKNETNSQYDKESAHQQKSIDNISLAQSLEQSSHFDEIQSIE